MLFFRIELWPGFITSILEYEQNLMLCLDVSHKVLRTDTVLDFLYDLQTKKGRGTFYDTATKALVGDIVLTRFVPCFVCQEYFTYMLLVC